ncbi:MAG: hypothetical protein JO092_03205 [Candidatus Eremiobacteraeota bacterium]|nr:hypothetical protein [Candidatus Eremiobacteraeota bacterium]
MDEYFIGAGALLTAGPAASIAGAALHAQPAGGLGGQMQAAVVDFEGTEVSDLSRLLVVAGGWSGPRFQREVVRRLLMLGECDLGDVLSTLAEGVGATELHLFANWVPDAKTTEKLAQAGVRLQHHPLDALGQAALVSGQRVARWRPGRAA